MGKTTVSRALAKAIGAKLISIDEIADRNWDGGTVRLYVEANGIVAKVARPALTRGETVVVDGCFYWRTQIRDLERRLRFPHVVITLQAPLAVCIGRDARREVVHGSTAAELVFRKATRFDWGVSVDATQSVVAAVKEIRSHLPIS